MRFHQLAGLAALLFIVVHPFLYAAPRLSPEPIDAVTSLERMFTSDGLRTGVIAWVLLLVFIPLAVWRERLPISYEAWRLSHAFGAALITLLAVHHTLRVGTYSEDPWLAGFWILLTVLAMLTLLYIYVLKPRQQFREPYEVIANRRVAERTWELTIQRERGSAIDFAPGQFAWLNLGWSPYTVVEHPFSISSAPVQRPRLSFTIKERGDFTNRIGEVPLGTRAYLDGPHGNFSTAGRITESIVFIAGGVGLAPMMGILRQLNAERYPYPLHLIYGNRVESQILYHEELKSLQESLDLKLDFVLSDPPEVWVGRSGMLDSETVKECLQPGWREAHYFVCGPSAMMDSAEQTLLERGVPARNIILERFTYD